MYGLLLLLWPRSSAPLLRGTICCRCFGFEVQVGATLWDLSNDNKSYIWAWGKHSETTKMATNRRFGHGDTISRPKQRQQQILYVRIGDQSPLRDQCNGNIFELGHHFETKATATNRTSQHWGTASRLLQRCQIVHLSIGTQLPDEVTATKRTS